MRRFLLIASAAAIALVGLSANQCGGDDKQAAPETPPAETPAPATPPAEPATPPAESPPPAEPPAQQ